MRHRTYNSIQALLADGRWHDACELEQVTPYAREWLEELRHDPSIEVKDDGDSILVRRVQGVLISA